MIDEKINKITAKQSGAKRCQPLGKIRVKKIGSNYLPTGLGALLLVSLVLLGGCDSAKESYSSEDSSAEAASEPAMEASAPDAAAPAPTVEQLTNTSEATLGSEIADTQIAGKEFVINAEAKFKVEDVVDTTHKVDELTQKYGGFSAASQIESIEGDTQYFRQGDKRVALTTYHRQATMTVRIPKPKVNDFLRDVQQQVLFLASQNFSAQDVTLDLYRQQLEQQLNSDKMAELSAQRLDPSNEKTQASNLDSINATYLARQQQELASLQKMDIADKVKYSTIALQFTQPDSVYKEVTQSIDAVLEEEGPSFGQQAKAALLQGWESIQTAILWLISTWWFWVVLGALYLLYRMLRKGLQAMMTSLRRRQLRSRNDMRQRSKENQEDNLQ